MNICDCGKEFKVGDYIVQNEDGKVIRCKHHDC